MTEIKPALTPDEWAWFAEHGSFVDVFISRDGIDVSGERHEPQYLASIVAKANAALPDDDPRKITQADVRNVEDAIGTIMMGVRVESLSIQGLWDLAAKLAALLPPV